VDLEADPQGPARLIASTQQGVIGSPDEGGPGATPVARLKFSGDGGQTWQDRGSTGGESQAMFADTADHLLVALIDGSVKESDDGGRTWTDLVTPPA
jgi:photosystem II stability/assembly factor-like uncharacterized protein